jgi:hypothetical protein
VHRPHLEGETDSPESRLMSQYQSSVCHTECDLCLLIDDAALFALDIGGSQAMVMMFLKVLDQCRILSVFDIEHLDEGDDLCRHPLGHDLYHDLDHHETLSTVMRPMIIILRRSICGTCHAA